jgi:hypothetical protein
LNSRPPDYESGALPTKLQWRRNPLLAAIFRESVQGTRLSVAD